MPGGGQGAGFGFSVADDAGGDQVRVVQHRSKGMGQAVSQLAALMDGAGRFRRHMTGDAAGEGELLKQLAHTVCVERHVGIDLRIAAIQPVLCHHGIASVPRPGQVDHIEIILSDHTVQMGIDKVLSGDRAPMTNDFVFDVFAAQWFAQQRIVKQIKLARSQIIAGTPPGIQQVQLLIGRTFHKKPSFLLPDTCPER
ncbi:hypothetical protein SDC9_147572 [bioreactor metagenome]|uniref:Uncharacterized protein n=1 Tax=bioreactor metagenome TaxID=1076179 RepID=A0A645EEE3_9ZZZZ